MSLSLASTDRQLPVSHDHQDGFTLVEVLVAIVILSIGVLGAVGMQAAAMQSNKEVRYQAIAGALARELAEKMRGNHAVGVKISAAENPYLLNATFTSADTVSAPTPNCFTDACPTGLQIAAWDIYEWQLRLIDALPSPRVRICMDKEPFTTTGEPKWACTDTGDVAILKLSWNRANAQGTTEFTSNAATPPLIVLPLTAGSSE
ncbi:MAG: type IV pilus modification protein PilV [Polaromonas sp.]|uniref:type IV pilus modification protein PilV n=1 Tax=Polaromonas sp. TaxID=1869339 RepID=UPI00272EFF50|nr:type IV pilus modification protein PilV [Polaromonas sp.]MDP2257583.1 type IV pilus modification protein PilV [Polaromonas sp.]